MLYTNLKHIETASDLASIINKNENVVVIYGRMDPKCVPAYRLVEELESTYTHVNFFDMESDNPESDVIRSWSEVQGITGIPIAIYFKNGKVIKATSELQTKVMITAILDKEFTETIAV